MSSPVHASREELIALLEERERELAATREQQAATAEVLRAINAPAFDLDAILSTLTTAAARLCEAGSSALFLREGDKLVARGTANLSEDQDAFVRRAASPIDDTSYIGRAVLHGTISNIPDFLAWAGSSLTAFQQKLQFNSMLVVPLMNNERGVGVFTLARKPFGEFTQRQVDLVQLFADQAAIAVQNAQLIDQLQTRTDDLALSLDQLRETEARLARSERLASLGRLIAGVAHEINTPVGNALTVSSTIEHESARLVREMNSGRLQKSDLTRSAARMAEGSTLIRTNLSRAIDLLQRFRQVASGNAGGELRRIELKSWAESLIRNHLALRESQHRWIVACADDLQAVGHHEDWASIIGCLIENSLQHGFTDDVPGTIRLSIDGSDHSGLTFRFEDDGKGIPAGEIDHVFEPFYTTARGRGAIGLGLHIVYNLVAGLGGQISVESAAKSGAGFVIQLPKA